MIKYIFLCFTFLLYNQQKCASEISIPSPGEIAYELEYIIKRENDNIERLNNNLKRFTTYYFDNIKEIEFDGDLVRQDEIITDTLTEIKMKWFMTQHINKSAECFYDMLSDLEVSYKNFDNDSEQCKIISDATFDRFSRDFFALKKDANRIIKQVTNILRMCKLSEEIAEEERWNCLRMDIPIKQLSIIANHTYQYEMRNVDRTDKILQDYRECNLLAVKPAAEMAQHFLENMKNCYFGEI